MLHLKSCKLNLLNFFMNLDILEQLLIYSRVGHTSCSGLQAETPPRMPWRLVDEDFGNDDYSMNVFTYD